MQTENSENKPFEALLGRKRNPLLRKLCCQPNLKKLPYQNVINQDAVQWTTLVPEAK